MFSERTNEWERASGSERTKGWERARISERTMRGERAKHPESTNEPERLMTTTICHHQIPRSQCLHCMHAELELLRAERQQLRVAVYEALHALLFDDVGAASVALCRVTEDA